MDVRTLIMDGFTEVFQLYMAGNVMGAQARLEQLIVELEAM